MEGGQSIETWKACLFILLFVFVIVTWTHKSWFLIIADEWNRKRETRRREKLRKRHKREAEEEDRRDFELLLTGSSKED